MATLEFFFITQKKRHTYVEKHPGNCALSAETGTFGHDTSAKLVFCCQTWRVYSLVHVSVKVYIGYEIPRKPVFPHKF